MDASISSSTVLWAVEETTRKTEEESLKTDNVLFWGLNQHPVTVFNFSIYCAQTIVAAFILLLNGLVLDTMVRQGKSREPADLLVAGLALTDALTGVFIVYNVIYNMAYFQDSTECLVRFGLGHALLAVSDFHLLCLTVDRSLKILTPYRYQNVCGKWTVWVAMTTSWLLGLVIGLLPAFGWNQSGDFGTSGEPVCTYFGVMDHDFLRLYMVVINTPILVTALLYVKLFLVARKHVAAIAAQPGERTAGHSDHAWRYAKTVLLIVGVYFACWVPMGGLVVFVVTGHLDDVSNTRKGDFILYFSSVVFINSIINPIIYAFKIPAIRRRFRSVFCARCFGRCLKDEAQTGTDTGSAF